MLEMFVAQPGLVVPAYRVSQRVSVVLAVLVLHMTVVAADCVQPVVPLAIKNITLSDGNVRRGVSAKVGTPPKELAFQPLWSVNNTFVFGPDCPKGDFITTEAACETFRGGTFNANDSSSHVPVPDSFTPGSERWSNSSYKFYADSLLLQDNAILKSFPLALPLNVSEWDLQAYTPMNLLGMGEKSILMDTLLRSHRIASKSFGYFWGLDGVQDRDQTTGSFVLGGYDKSKTIGDGFTNSYSSKSTCSTGMIVTIRDIILNFRNGTDTSLFPTKNEGNALLACIVPQSPVVMSMPREDYFNTLLASIVNVEAGRSVGIDWWNVVLDPENLYSGDMTVSFDQNFEITIPNRQLIVPDRNIMSDGSIATNGSRPVIRIDSLQDTTGGALPILGRYFFTSAYLYANEDSGEFTLWQANPTTSEEFVAMDKSSKPVSSCVTLPGSETETGSGGGATETPSSTGGSLTTGAIAGIAVGGAALAILAIGGAIFFFLRRRKAKATRENQAPLSAANFEDKSSNYGGIHPYHAAGYPPQEVHGHGPGQGTTINELQG